jgi:hypothetical protein
MRDPANDDDVKVKLLMLSQARFAMPQKAIYSGKSLFAVTKITRARMTDDDPPQVIC